MYTECIIKHIPYKPDQGYSEHLRLRRLCCNYIYSYGGRDYNSFVFCFFVARVDLRGAVIL